MDAQRLDRNAAERSADRPAAVAQAILAGFDRHFGLTRYIAQQAKSRYERGDWHGIRRLARDRIAFYDQRVREAVERLESEFALGQPSLDEVFLALTGHSTGAGARHGCGATGSTGHPLPGGTVTG